MQPLAIVGISCRFPGGASDPQAFWGLLREGYDAVVRIPPDRWDTRRFYDPAGTKPGRAYTDRGAFLHEDVATFDPLFFGMSPREAQALDPQQRLLLECSWEAFEDAGVPVEALQAVRTGVFVGGFCLDSKLLQLSVFNQRLIDAHTPTGSTMAILANRVSHAFNLCGPSVTMDTACSSSLVAFHYAAQSIWRGEADAALAAGVNVMTRPEYSVAMSQGRFLSREGRCAAFDQGASGYVRGEGAGVVLLKPLDAALRDNDRIHALVVATGVNQDGRTAGIAQPSGAAQERLIRELYTRAGISPAQVDYVEAHGTGTQVGDTAELSAIHRVFEARATPVIVGSVKTNIGHLEAAAGVAGVIKTSLALAHAQIPQNLHFEQPNPALDYPRLNVEIPTQRRAWPRADHPRQASINSFGYGGTNAHAVLRAAPPRSREGARVLGLVPVLVSARSEAALHARARQLAEVCTASRTDAVDFADLAWTLNTRRAHLSHRAVVVAEDVESCARGLSDIASGGGIHAQTRAGEVAWVYTGMGPQRPGMGLQLLATEPVFARAAREVDDTFRALSGWSLLDALRVPRARSRIARTEVAQPANLLVQVGLTALFRSWGAAPNCVVGHSVGEVAAAWACGALSLADAVLVSYHRSRLQQRLAGRGGMLAVGLDAEVCATRYTSAEVSVAAINAAGSATLSGPLAALRAIAAELETQQIFARLLDVEVPYHCAMMDELHDELHESLALLDPQPTHTPMVSSVTGREIEGAGLDADYWWRNVRCPVRFADALAEVVARGAHVALEVGPHPVLRAAVAQAGLENLATLHRKRPDEQRAAVEALARLHCLGVDVSVTRWTTGEGRLVDLPRYPWQRTRCWRETEVSRQHRLGNPGPVWFGKDLRQVDPGWEVEADTQMFPWLADHVVQGREVFPGAAYVQAAALVQARLSGHSAGRLDEVVFHQMLALQDDQIQRLQLLVTAPDRLIRIVAATEDDELDWKTLATANYLPLDLGELAERSRVDLEQTRRRCSRASSPSEIYERLAAAGLRYGPRFQTLSACAIDAEGTQVLARLVPRGGDADETALLDPCMLDGAFQAMALLAPHRRAYVPRRIARIRIYEAIEGPRWAVVTRRATSTANTIIADIALVDDQGQVCVALEGVVCQGLGSVAPPTAPRFDLRWVAERDTRSLTSTPRLLLLGAEPAMRSALERQASVDVEAFSMIDELDYDGVWISIPAMVRGDVEALAAACVELGQLVARLACRSNPPTLGLLLRDGDPGHEALCAWLAVVENEYPQLQTRAVLISADSPEAAWVHAVLTEDERVVRWRSGRRQVRRLEQPAAASGVRHVDPHAVPIELHLGRSGQPDSLRWALSRRRSPGPGEVEIRVSSTALNFKDLLKIYGRLADAVTDGTYFGRSLGMEVSGEVVAIGAGVRRAKVGDRVVTPTPDGAFCSHVTVPEHYVIPVPQGMAIEDAPLMLGYLTALWGLAHVARLGAGERVLIHNATGGVGIAALQVAKLRDAQIYATAGTPEKRAWLLDQGVEHIYPSRDLSFAERIRHDTRGAGVDVVLSAMSGDASRESLDLLAPFGRFIEIGKQDISANAKLPLRAFQNNLSFASVDIDRMLVQRRAIAQGLLEEIGARFESGEFEPARVRRFAAPEVQEAIRSMSRGEHIGKLVLTYADTTVPVAADPGIRADASYLVTGGTRGFGLEVGAWLLDQGAGRVVLVSRGGARPESHLRWGDDARVDMRAVDVTDEAQVRALMQELVGGPLPLRGVFHGAMVLDDGLLSELDSARYTKVLAPKITGAHLLDEYAGELDHFVCFSSISSMIGTRGQANYVVANAWLDAFVATRRAAGRPALTVNLGALADTGVVHRNEGIARVLRASGLVGLASSAVLEALGHALSEPAQELEQIGLFEVDWAQLAASVPRVARDRLFSTQVGVEHSRDSLASTLAALPQAEREREVASRIVTQVAKVMRIPDAEVSLHTSLDRLGIDSLVAVELTALLARTLEVEVSPVDVLSGPSVLEFTRLLLGRMITEEDELLAKVDGLSEAELDTLLASLAAEDEATS